MIRTLPVLLYLLCPVESLAQSDWEDLRGIAQAQHEIIVLLIEKQQFGEVAAAAEKLFSLEFPVDQEELVEKEAKILTDMLLGYEQMAVAHQVLDLAIRFSKSNRVRAELYREKAYVCKKEGKEDEAMRNFEKSIELQKSGS